MQALTMTNSMLDVLGNIDDVDELDAAVAEED